MPFRCGQNRWLLDAAGSGMYGRLLNFTFEKQRDGLPFVLWFFEKYLNFCVSLR
ncbi:hypothetical protein Cabys_3325 [Caldithrix abyssi DSM 13497]|uniref:Uncharacterized protein n=1 Tax=Caldithrix abyssi DSM 13497 TaxID=880073 RepID=A0A1J1CCU2_CALAY|nr:hypothetical protein Cabys_3325 [Caldithrix abyssi DSM 13497]